MVHVPCLVVAFGRVQAKYKVENTNILNYFHYYAHCINLALVDYVCGKVNSASGLKNSKLTIFLVLPIQFIYIFIEGSPNDIRLYVYNIYIIVCY